MNCEFVIFIYIVLYSLFEMNLFHILVLFVMVFAQFYPKTYAKNALWFLVYANIVLCSKYIYSVACTNADPTATTCDGKVWEVVIGVWSKNYNPNLDVSQMFWRCPPPMGTWFFLLAVGMQYRRNLYLGNDEKKIENEEN